MKLNIDEKKRFFLIIGVGLGVLLLVMGYDSSIRQASALTREKSQSREDDLEDTKDKFLGLEGRAESENRILEKEFLPDIKEKIEFPDSLPTTPPGEDAAIHLRQELADMQRKVKNAAARKDLGLPRDWDIGAKIKKNNTERDISKLRLRLAATNAVIKKCVECNALRIRKVAQKQETVNVIENAPTKYIQRLPFLVEFEGSLQAVTGVLFSFQKEGSFLEVQSCGVSGSSRKGILLAKVQFAALTLLDRSQVEEATGKPPPADKGSRPPVRRGTRRRQRY